MGDFCDDACAFGIGVDLVGEEELEAFAEGFLHVNEACAHDG